MIAFACAAMSLGGILITMLLVALPIPGPTGGRIRGMAPLFGVAVAVLWFAGLVLGLIGLRQRGRIRTFARAALALCGAMAGLIELMSVLQY